MLFQRKRKKDSTAQSSRGPKPSLRVAMLCRGCVHPLQRPTVSPRPLVLLAKSLRTIKPTRILPLLMCGWKARLAISTLFCGTIFIGLLERHFGTHSSTHKRVGSKWTFATVRSDFAYGFAMTEKASNHRL